MKRIKALNKLEFDSSESYGTVYGQYKRLYVYIELGQETEYREHPKDDPKTKYRRFINCTVEYSESEDQAEQGIYQYKDTDVDVILYW